MHTHTHLLTHTYTENIYTYKQYLQKKKEKKKDSIILRDYPFIHFTHLA